MIPLFIDCSGRRIVIFGGGTVAARKAAYFSGKADVTVVSRSFVPAFDGLQVNRQELDLVTATEQELASILTGAFLVIAALSDPEINNRIGRLCRATGILFNNADGETGDVILPAVTRGENYTLAISTGGNSPAVSRYIREQLEQELPGAGCHDRAPEPAAGRTESTGARPDRSDSRSCTRCWTTRTVWEAL